MRGLGLRGQRTQGLGRDQDADAARQLTELRRVGAHVAQIKQDVLNEWMIDQVDHGAQSLAENRTIAAP